MRIFEALFLFSNLVLSLDLLSLYAFGSSQALPLVKYVIVLLGFTFLGLHNFTEGRRWQLVPGYLSFVINTVSFYFVFQSLINGYSNSWLSVILVLFSLILTLLSFLLAFFLPVLAFPSLKGPFEVGTITLHLVDQTRPEWTDPNETRRRELLIQVLSSSSFFCRNNYLLNQSFGILSIKATGLEAKGNFKVRLKD